MQANFQKHLDEFQSIQNEMRKVIGTRQQLEAQMHENTLVLEQFKKMKNESEVYKLVGPVLVKQEKVEAEQNVEKRISFIKGEIERVEKTLKDVQERQEKKRELLVKLSEAQKQAQEAN